MNKILIFLNLVILTCLAISSCGKVYSSGSQAEMVMSPLSGYVCFLIRDENGTGVGGNCLKSD